MGKIISVKKEGYITTIKICGIKITLKNKYKELENKVLRHENFINNLNYILANDINREKINLKIKNFSETGITEQKRDKKVIVTLTSYPDRIYEIHYVIYSLLQQTFKPDMVILRLSEEEFPNKELDLTDNLLKLKNNGLSIKWCKNIRSYKKLIPALKEFPNDILVTADDDIYYPTNWLEKLYNSYLKNKERIHCHRAHKINFKDGKVMPYSTWESCINNSDETFLTFPTGCGGVLYPPGCFYHDVINENLFMSLAPNGDDIWFWAMSTLKGTRCVVVDDPINDIKSLNPKRDLGYGDEATLYKYNGQGGNDEQLKAVIKKYHAINQILKTNFVAGEFWNKEYETGL